MSKINSLQRGDSNTYQRLSASFPDSQFEVIGIHAISTVARTHQYMNLLCHKQRIKLAPAQQTCVLMSGHSCVGPAPTPKLKPGISLFINGVPQPSLNGRNVRVDFAHETSALHDGNSRLFPKWLCLNQLHLRLFLPKMREFGLGHIPRTSEMVN